MRLSDMAVFKPERRNGPVTVTKQELKPKVLDLIEAVNANPGGDYKIIARYLGGNTEVDYRNTSARLASYVKGKAAQFKRIKQDGMWRYYPINYRLITDTPAPTIPRQVVPKVPKTEPIEELIKRYCWEQNADSTPFKEFLTWYNNG